MCSLHICHVLPFICRIINYLSLKVFPKVLTCTIIVLTLSCNALGIYQIQKTTFDDNEIKSNQIWIRILDLLLLYVKPFRKTVFLKCSKYRLFYLMWNCIYHFIFIMYIFLFYFSSLFMHITNLTSCWEVNWILLKLLNYANCLINPQHWPQVYIFRDETIWILIQYYPYFEKFIPELLVKNV